MKITRAQIREAERSRIAKQYLQKITLLEKSIEEHSKLRIEALNRAQKTIEANQKLREENDELKEKIAQRVKAKEAKDYALADSLRDEIEREGIEVLDTAQGPVWQYK